jgi:hypothetical protein
MSEMRVTSDFYRLRIWCGNVLHLSIDNSRLLGFQAWQDGPSGFRVEFVLAGGTLTTEYDSLEKWLAVLRGLEEVL